jgi:hypothetical protein
LGLFNRCYRKNPRASFETWQIIESNDAIRFWALIESTHKASDTVDEDIRRIIEEIKFQLVQQPNQSLDSYCEESTLKIQRLKSLGGKLEEKKKSIQFLIGLNREMFSRQVGHWMSIKDCIPDTYQKTKDMVQNWFKGQVTANALHFSSYTSSKARSSTNEDVSYDQISSSVEETKAIRCIYCSKTGHGAQTCPKLINWLSKQKTFHQKQKHE